MKILDKMFGREKEETKEVTSNNITVPDEVQPELSTPSEIDYGLKKPKTLSGALKKYGTVVSKSDYGDIAGYMDKGYACVTFSAGCSSRSFSKDTFYYDFCDPDYKFKLKEGLDGILDFHELINIFGKDVKNRSYSDGTVGYDHPISKRMVLPLESLENLDDEYLAKLEDLTKTADIFFYNKPTRNSLHFQITLKSLSSNSKRIPKIAKRYSRLVDKKIAELKKNQFKTKTILLRLIKIIL
jgi:hypothetical protein